MLISTNILDPAFKNFAAILTFIVASSTTVPKVRSPSATTIAVLPPVAKTFAGEQPIFSNDKNNIETTVEKAIIFLIPKSICIICFYFFQIIYVLFLRRRSKKILKVAYLFP